MKVVAGGVTESEEIHSRGSYLSQDDLRVHRLGSATKIDRVEIRWPSGTVDALKELDGDQFYAVLEGKGIVARDQIAPLPPFLAKP